MHKSIYVLTGIIGILLIILVRYPGQTTGQAILSPIKIEGSVIPRLENGANITFKVGNVIIASDLLKDSKYGPVWFKLDDPKKLGREGYKQGDQIRVYVEGIEVGEISFLAGNRPIKNITIPPTLRPNVTIAVQEMLNCEPDWECTKWGLCKEKVQERECTDNNECRFDGKPETKRSCTQPVIYEEPTIMTFFEEFGVWIYLGIGLLAILIGVSAATKRPKRRTSKK